MLAPITLLGLIALSVEIMMTAFTPLAVAASATVLRADDVGQKALADIRLDQGDVLECGRVEYDIGLLVCQQR